MSVTSEKQAQAPLVARPVNLRVPGTPIYNKQIKPNKP